MSRYFLYGTGFSEFEQMMMLVPNFTPILAAITEGDSIQNKLTQLSDFCVKYAEHGIREKPHLDTLVECFEPLTAKDLNAIMDSLHEFEIFKGIQSAEDYGRYMIIDSGHFEYDENLEEYIDFGILVPCRLKTGGKNGIRTHYITTRGTVSLH